MAAPNQAAVAAEAVAAELAVSDAGGTGGPNFPEPSLIDCILCACWCAWGRRLLEAVPALDASVGLGRPWAVGKVLDHTEWELGSEGTTAHRRHNHRRPTAALTPAAASALLHARRLPQATTATCPPGLHTLRRPRPPATRT